MSSYNSVEFFIKKDGESLADFYESFPYGLKFYSDDDITTFAADSLISINMHETKGEYEIFMKFYYDSNCVKLSHTTTVRIEQADVVQVISKEIIKC